MERKKILFISSWFPNRLEPTNGNFVQRHAEAVSLLCDVEILHAIGNFEQKELYVYDDRMINGIRTLIIYYKNSKNPVQNFLRRMRAYLNGFSKMNMPDLVHANVLHNNMLFAVYLKKNTKFHLWLQSTGRPYRSRIFQKHPVILNVLQNISLNMPGTFYQ